MSVGTYKIIELVGSSGVSWEDAAKNAVEMWRLRARP
jgi:flavin-binding protein dodecin